MNTMKRQKAMTWEDEHHHPPNLEAVQFATVDEWRATTNSSRINEVAGPKQKRCSTVDVSSGESKV